MGRLELDVCSFKYDLTISLSGIYYGFIGWQQISPVKWFGVHHKVLKTKLLGNFFSIFTRLEQVLCKL